MVPIIEENRVLWGWIVLITGALFLLQALNVVPSTVWEYLWPIVVMIAGAQLVKKK